ncbi:MAG: PAS domain S-box protein, partial [Bacteroidota bacterium]
MQNNPPFPGQDFQAPFGALFDYATEAILVTDSQGFILRANPSAEKLFGYEHGELTGKPVEVLIPSRFAERHNSHRASFHRS